MVNPADIMIKKEDVIKIGPNELLSSALSKLGTSHDAAFVFDRHNKFLGVINPYYCLIKSSFPGNAKVEHCLFHPPVIHIDYPLAKILELIIGSKIHYLPVVDENNTFLGITSARRTFCLFDNSPVFKMQITDYLKTINNPLITVSLDDSLSTAINIFKKRKISKLIVIGPDMKLKGILTYYDLISYLMSPQHSIHRGERGGIKVNFYQEKVQHFAKTYVLTLTPKNTLMDAVHLILKKRIGSVVIVDKDRHPIGIITTRDLLRLLIRSKDERKIQIVSSNLSDNSRQTLGGFFNSFKEKIEGTPQVKGARLFVKEEKKGSLFKVVLSIFFHKGQSKVLTKEGNNLSSVLKTIKGDSKAQLRPRTKALRTEKVS